MVCNIVADTNKTSKIVSDIVLMHNAKVSTNIMAVYINNIDVIPKITTEDIILLTTNGISDSIIQVLLNKDRESKKLINKYISTSYYRESYEFFNDVYLRPRAKYYSQKNYENKYHYGLKK